MENTFLRSIVIFPQFENQELINELRAMYDPLYRLIAPHITLVFPFRSDITTGELEEHIWTAVQGITPFTIELAGISGTLDKYLFLNVKKGNDQLIELHDRLYQGSLAPYFYRKVPYIPHISVGHLTSDAEFEKALLHTMNNTVRFRTIVERIAVEQITPDGQSCVEIYVPLR